MKKIIDAHLHLKKAAQEGISNINEIVKTTALAGFVLILNSEEEQKVVAKYIAQANFPIPYALAIICSPHVPVPKEHFLFWKDNGIPCHIKIHPRISDIRQQDFKKVADMLSHIPKGVVIIDCFTYGPKIENHVGVELCIYLAKKFPQKIFVMAHAGGIKMLEALMLSRSLSNIYMDLSASCNYLYGSSVQSDMVHLLRYNHNNIMYGSDYPSFSVLEAQNAILNLAHQASLSDLQIDNLMYGNAHKIYFEKG